MSCYEGAYFFIRDPYKDLQIVKRIIQLVFLFKMSHVIGVTCHRHGLHQSVDRFSMRARYIHLPSTLTSAE